MSGYAGTTIDDDDSVSWRTVLRYLKRNPIKDEAVDSVPSVRPEKSSTTAPAGKSSGLIGVRAALFGAAVRRKRARMDRGVIIFIRREIAFIHRKQPCKLYITPKNRRV